MQMSQITSVVKTDAAAIGRNMWDLVASATVWYRAAAGETSNVNKKRLANIIETAGVPEGTRKYVLNLVHKGFDKWKGAVNLDATPAEARTALADHMKAEYGTLENMRKSFIKPKNDTKVEEKEPASNEAPAEEVADNGSKVVNFVKANIDALTKDHLLELSAIISNRMAEVEVILGETEREAA